jgi:hypothetical protein
MTGGADARIKEGSVCWYVERDGARRKVEVVAVDRAIVPFSYAVRFDPDTTRETEASRLELCEDEGAGAGAAGAGAGAAGAGGWAAARTPDGVYYFHR